MHCVLVHRGSRMVKSQKGQSEGCRNSVEINKTSTSSSTSDDIFDVSFIIRAQFII